MAVEQTSDRESPVTPLPQRSVDFLMDAISRAEERGTWGVIDLILRGRSMGRVERFADDALKQRIAGFRERLAAAQAYEAVHGKDSLVVKDHPFNIMLEEKRKEWERGINVWHVKPPASATA